MVYIDRGTNFYEVAVKNDSTDEELDQRAAESISRIAGISLEEAKKRLRVAQEKIPLKAHEIEGIARKLRS